MRIILLATILVSTAFAGTPALTNWSGPYTACANRSELSKADRMNLGVRFDTSSPEIARAFRRALAFWSRVLDMSYHEEASANCALALVDGTAEILHEANNVARAQFTDFANFQGWIAFDPHAAEYMSEDEIYATAVHELGHLFGLRHNPRASSIMFYLDCDGTSLLDQSDLAALSLKHTLRSSLHTAVAVLPAVKLY